MTFNEFKQLVIAECEAAGITEYELYYQAGSSVSVDTFMHSINEFSSSYSGGVCFRCIVGGKMGYASTEALNAEQAKAVVAKAADSATVLEADEQVFLGEGGQEYEELTIKPYDLPSTEELIKTVLEVQERSTPLTPWWWTAARPTASSSRVKWPSTTPRAWICSIRTTHPAWSW